MAAPAIELGPGVEGVVVEGCLFGDIQSTALRAGQAHDVRISESRFSYVASALTNAGSARSRSSYSESLTSRRSQIDHYPLTRRSSRTGPPSRRSRAGTGSQPR